MWCIRLTLAALLAKDYGLNGVWTAMAIELSLRGILFIIRIYRKQWMKKLEPDY
jgi:Na+-driven multidrug efflux pump